LSAVWVVATSQESYDHNELQLAIGGAMAAGLLLTGALVVRYGSNRKGGRAIVVTLLLTLILFAAWRYGFSAWCDGCGPQ
jgi:hypothetical protein